MDNEAFQYCCGAEEIGNLLGLTTKSLHSFLEAQLADLHADPDSLDYYPAGAFVATTTANQRAAVLALRANKFREVFTFVNPGTGNKVTLWARKLVRS